MKNQLITGMAYLLVLLALESVGLSAAHAAPNSAVSVEKIQKMKDSDKTLYYIEYDARVINTSIIIETKDQIVTVEEPFQEKVIEAVWRVDLEEAEDL